MDILQENAVIKNHSITTMVGKCYSIIFNTILPHVYNRMNYKITYQPHPTSEEIQRLNNGISHQAILKKNMTPIESFAFFIEDENGTMVGGCSGCHMYGSTYIDALWVHEALRKQGYGKALMLEAETLANKNNTNFMTVNTFDWEALDFYKHLGFHIEFERKGFDKDSIFYFLRKNLK